MARQAAIGRGKRLARLDLSLRTSGTGTAMAMRCQPALWRSATCTSTKQRLHVSWLGKGSCAVLGHYK